VTGPIKAHTFSGSVEIRAKGWRDQQMIDVDTFSGSIDVHLPDSARGTVTFNSFSGHLTSDLPLTLRTAAALDPGDAQRWRFGRRPQTENLQRKRADRSVRHWLGRSGRSRGPT